MSENVKLPQFPKIPTPFLDEKGRPLSLDDVIYSEISAWRAAWLKEADDCDLAMVELQNANLTHGASSKESRARTIREMLGES